MKYAAGETVAQTGFECMDYSTHEIEQFLDAVASSRVAPAGGSAAALTGAFGAALAEMAAHHTLANHGETTAGNLKIAKERLSQQRTVLLTLAGEDAQAIDALFADGAGEPDQATVSRATGIPLSIAEACVEILEKSLDIAERVDDNVRQDLHTALYLTVGAASAAIRTVEPNLDLLQDDDVRLELEKRAETTTERLSTAIDRMAERTDVEFFD
ncbi:MAG: cyclodeaminase/cyclohydrolase family protein [Halodesulfurarchaeum sp.]|nr:cyclodeaminase/cyclohydrolase family protein [Halodesulfurarchaeum sp.]